VKFLQQERRTLEEYLPGLDEKMSEISLLELEGPESKGIQLFRDVGGPGLLIPCEHSGSGASALEAIRIQRAIASRSPSLPVATTMHQFSVATLIELCQEGSGLEWLLLQAVAEQRLLIASGFAEGQGGRDILAPTMRATRTKGGFVVNGSKKPCSLSRSMSLLTATVTVADCPDRRGSLAVILVPANAPGLERRKFWRNWVLAGAESDELILRDVLAPERLVFYSGDGDGLDATQVSGFLWFELLITASYLGVASALVERAIAGRRGEAIDRALLGVEVEGAMAALESVAYAMMEGRRTHAELGRALFVRYAVQRAIERATAQAMELLGGMAFCGSSDDSYFFQAAHALAFHPPSRNRASPALADFLAGEPLYLR
jgi:alkylation response protein AidB-like acyl-CoA dehydrogenase